MYLLNALRGRDRRPAARRPSCAGRPPVLEPLEDRILLSYGFTLLADDGPDSLFSSLKPPVPLNDHGTAGGFVADLKSGGEGVFTRHMEGQLGILAITSDLISAFPVSGGINDAGTVVFGADLRAGGQAIFTGRGGPLSRIADTGPDSPFSGFLSLALPINNEGTVAFRASVR